MYIIDKSSFFTIYPGRFSIYKDFNVPFNGKNESIHNIIKKDKDIICSMLDEVKVIGNVEVLCFKGETGENIYVPLNRIIAYESSYSALDYMPFLNKDYFTYKSKGLNKQLFLIYIGVPCTISNNVVVYNNKSQDAIRFVFINAEIDENNKVIKNIWTSKSYDRLTRKRDRFNAKSKLLNFGTLRLDCYGRLNYKIPQNQTIVIVPSDIYAIEYDNTKVAGEVEKIELRSGIRVINLSHFIRLESVNIPRSVKTISENGFYRCMSLKELTIPESVTTIGEKAFFECRNLKKLTLPSKLETVKHPVFDRYFRGEVYLTRDTYRKLFAGKDEPSNINYKIIK
jgi:hypothetical protein